MNRHDQHRGIILYEYEIKAEWMFKTSNLHPWLYEFILQIRRVLIELNWIRYIRWNINIQNIFFAMFPKQTSNFKFLIIWIYVTHSICILNYYFSISLMFHPQKPNVKFYFAQTENNSLDILTWAMTNK